MYMTIYHPNSDFDFSKLYLSQPLASANGSFFSKINIIDTDDSLFIYTPKCNTRQGIVTTKDKIYTDLLFTSVNSNITQWLSLLEEHLQKLIFEKKDIWFATDNIELDDIQNAFIPIIKIYKNTQYLLRAYVQQTKQQLKGEPLLIYNENQEPCSMSSITEDNPMITILEIQGIKFSQKCFHIPIVIKQIMLFSKTSFQQCLISHDIAYEKQKQPEVKDLEVNQFEVTQPEIEEPVKIEIEELENKDLLKEVIVDIHDLDEIIQIQNPIEIYIKTIEKIKNLTMEAKKAYKFAKDIKQQFNIEEELPTF
jgi:hypothetical protein